MAEQTLNFLQGDQKVELIVRTPDVPTKRKIWTACYLPFAMGGDLNKPISTEVLIEEEIEYKSITFFSFTTPKQKLLRVSESVSGGIIASSFGEVIVNTRGCTPEFLLEQINAAKHLADSAKLLSNEEFFKLYEEET